MVFERVFLIGSKLSIVFIASIILTACGGGSSGTTSTQLNSSSADAIAPSSSDATSAIGTGTATLSWTPPESNTDGSVLSDLSGYRILYGRDASGLDQSIAITNPSLSVYVVENLTAGAWYFAVVAVNSLGIESELSGVVSKTIS